MEILSEEVINQQGSFKRIRRWISGWHPKLGVLIFGLTGKETVVETHSISPLFTLTVEEGN